MPSPAHVRAHILVVDDHEAIRDIVKVILEQHGYRVSQAANGSDAIHKSVALKPDLVLLDLAMPGVNGAEVAVTLHEAMPDMPILVLTMYEGAAEKLLGEELWHFGISGVISKINGLNTLIERVEKILFPHKAAQALGPIPLTPNGNATAEMKSKKA